MIIKTPSRLHMSLIDLNGSYGRIDGGIGLTIKEPNFSLYGETSEKGIIIDFDKSITNNSVKLECEKKILDAANKAINYFNIDNGFYFKVKEAYLPHSGLGSGTQIGLATSKIIAESIGEKSNGLDLGNIVGRGGTSGIGIFSFDHGGFIVDGGHSLKEKKSFLPSSASQAKPPQLIGHYDFPEEWDILIVILNSNNSVSGNKEVNIFQDYCPVPKNEVEQVSHLIFMNLIPFLLEKDIEAFGHVIDQIQTKGFKHVEVSLQSDKIKNLMDKMRDLGAYGVGMSSFGPTVYTIFDKNNKSIVKNIKEYVGNDGIVFTTKAQNYGYEFHK